MRVCACACVRARACARARVCARACVCVCVCACYKFAMQKDIIEVSSINSPREDFNLRILNVMQKLLVGSLLLSFQIT